MIAEEGASLLEEASAHLLGFGRKAQRARCVYSSLGVWQWVQLRPDQSPCLSFPTITIAIMLSTSQGWRGLAFLSWRTLSQQDAYGWAQPPTAGEGGGGEGGGPQSLGSRRIALENGLRP